MKNTRGWDKVNGSLTISDELSESIKYWRNMASTTKKIHISTVECDESLCGNATKGSFLDEVKTITPVLKKSLCKNCIRILMTTDLDTVKGGDIKSALKTLSGKPSRSLNKNKTSKKKPNRLKGYKDALDKTPEDFLAAMTKANQNKIVIPNEIGPEKSSLLETLTAASQVLTAIRRCAILNLDRLTNDWRKMPSEAPEEFTTIQEAKDVKSLISSIDKIKKFQKQNS